MAGVTKEKLKTDKNVRDFIADTKKAGKPDTRTDTIVPGLTLSVTAKGTASWLLRYYIGAARKTITIGQFHVWGLSDARERAKELRRNVDVGVDVAVKKQQDKLAASTAWTVDDLAAAYFVKAENELVPHTFKQRKSEHARFVSPQIGNFPRAIALEHHSG